MIRVLVVDDEKLVRQGIISSLPWEQFDMQVVGEAKNGEKALEFLEQHEVELVLTDLAMPVMSGIELMRIVRRQYPELYIIVLTLHQDFEYIQEALRLGAIDYIAKVELVQERFCEILARIQERIKEEMHKGKQLRASDLPAAVELDQGYALLSLGERPDSEWLRGLYSGQPGEGPNERLRFCYPADKQENDRLLAVLTEAVQNQPDWVLLCLGGLRGLEKFEVAQLVESRMEHLLFYMYDSTVKRICRSVRELQEELPNVSEREIAEAGEQWTALGWIHNDERFTAYLDRLKEMKLPVSRLMRFLFKVRDECNVVFGSILEARLELPEQFNAWYEVEEWFQQIRQAMSRVLTVPHYSREVHDAVLKAIQLIQEHLGEPLYAADIAKRVNVSRSYFSQCFRDVVGKNFNDYVRQARIDKAKDYLVHTNMPILWVAEKTGYLDGKYFSTMFRDQTGLLPSAFRKIHRQEKDE